VNPIPVTAAVDRVEHRRTAVGSIGESRPSGTGLLYGAMIAGYPLAWALGLGPVVFPAVAVLMVVWLIRFRPLRVPGGTISFALFLVLVAASVIEVDSMSRVALWSLRLGWYAAAFVTFVYLARQTSSRARLVIVRSLIVLWAFSIAGGYGALVAPDLSWSTPVSAVLPSSIASDDFVRDLVVPRMAEVQTFWTGVRLDRPAAPFPYTNAWGSSVALLTPFVLAALQDRRIGLPRWVVVAMLAAGLVPFYFALNRGAWLSLLLGVAYGGLRSALVNRRLVPLTVVTGVAALGLLLASTTGVLDTAIEQLQTRSADSNETRANIYLETIEQSARSPMIGHGTPRPNPSNPDGPPLGTHGQIWAIMFAHGYLALALYVAFFIYGFVRARAPDSISHWAKVAVLIGLLQMPIYGHLPTQLFIMMGAVSIAAWPAGALDRSTVS
jgi:hypothetical protein